MVKNAGTKTLKQAPNDKYLETIRRGHHQRSDSEKGDTKSEDFPCVENVAAPAPQYNTACDGDTVGVEYPSKIANRQVELQLDRGQQQWSQCDRHDKCNVCRDRPDYRCV